MDKIATHALVDMLRRRFSTLKAIFLFGSQALEGGANANSDVDLGLLFSVGHEPSILDLWDASSACADLLKTDVDLVSLRQTTTVMQHQIINSGHSLYHSNCAEAYLFEVYVNKEKNYLDEAITPHLDEIIGRGFVYAR